MVYTCREVIRRFRRTPILRSVLAKPELQPRPLWLSWAHENRKLRWRRHHRHRSVGEGL